MEATDIRLAVGETHRLRLTGRGSAGYGWEMSVTGDGEAVRVTKEFLPLPPTLPTGGPLPPGYSRDEEVVITALAPGTATVRLVQRRAWEREKPPLKELLLGVRVTGRAGGAD